VKDWIAVALLAVWALAFFALRLPAQQSVQASRDAPPVQHAARVDPRRSAPASQAPAAAPSFGGYPCVSGDCAEDKAGFRWAQANAIADPDECAGNSGAFIEGCRVYARRNDRFGDSASPVPSGPSG